MSNHAHIAVSCTDTAGLILRIKSGYTRYFNRKYGRTGPLMTYSYCQVVREYLRQRVMISYILHNPMHHGICETPFQYPFSSISAYFPDALSPSGPKGTRETPMGHCHNRGINKNCRQPMADLELCRYIDRELLPRLKIPSYIHIGNEQKKQIAQTLKDRFHISTEQAMRCLGGS